MRNVKLSVKIGFGFGLLILVMALLGGFTIWRMGRVGEQATRLAHEYVPEVEISNNLERASLETMYAMRGYSLTGEEKFLKEAHEHLKAVEEHLDHARKHAEKYPRLVKLKNAVDDVAKAVASYEEHVDETQKLMNDSAAARDKADKAAGEYMKYAGEFLNGQNEAMRQKEKKHVLRGPILFYVDASRFVPAGARRVVFLTPFFYRLQ